MQASVLSASTDMTSLASGPQVADSEVEDHVRGSASVATASAVRRHHTPTRSGVETDRDQSQ